MKNKKINVTKRQELKKMFEEVVANEDTFFLSVFPRFSLKIAKILSILLTNKEIVWANGCVSYYSQRFLPCILRGLVNDKRVKDRDRLYQLVRFCRREEAGTEEEIEAVQQKLLSHPAVRTIRCWTENPKNRWLLKDRKSKK